MSFFHVSLKNTFEIAHQRGKLIQPNLGAEQDISAVELQC